MRRESVITVTATGANIATGVASASVAIPNTSAGTRPAYVRVASTQAAYVRLGVGAATAAAGDLLVNPGESPLLAVGGATHIAALQVATGGIVNIIALEDIG